MKILYVVHQFFPECFSGTEQYCLFNVREARRRGHEAEVLTLEPGGDPPQGLLRIDREDYEDVPVHRLRHWWGLASCDTLREYENPLVEQLFRRFLDEFRPDVLHVFHLRNLGLGFLRAAREKEIRIVVHLMDFWFVCPEFTLRRTDGVLCEGPPDEGRGCVACHRPGLDVVWQDPSIVPTAHRFTQAASRFDFGWSSRSRFEALMQRPGRMRSAFLLADRVIAPSRFLRDMFAKNGFDTTRIEVVPYGLPAGRVQRREVERPRTPIRLTFAGVLSPWKGPHIPIRAVRATDGDLRLSIRGRLEEPMFADYIRSLREAASGDDRISFDGAFDHSELSDVLADTDLLVVPSTWYENTPFVMLEAFAAGVPVIASDLGGMTELIDEGRNGFSFPAGDDVALAALLGRLVQDPQQIAALSVEQPTEIESNLDRFEEIYRSAAQPR